MIGIERKRKVERRDKMDCLTIVVMWLCVWLAVRAFQKRRNVEGIRTGRKAYGKK